MSNISASATDQNINKDLPSQLNIIPQVSQYSLMENLPARDSFRQIFLSCLGIDKPVVQLSNLPHWRAFVQQKGITTPVVNSLPTLLLNGFFYNFSSAVPTASELQAGIKLANSLGAKQILIPSIRDDANIQVLLDAGFMRLPAGEENLVEIETEMAESLRLRVGTRRFRELRRLFHKAESGFTLEIFKAKEILLYPQLLEFFVSLHKLHADRHQSPINIYSQATVFKLLETSLAPCLRFLFRRCRQHSKVVQVGLLLESSESDTSYYLTQAIARHQVGSGQNLYAATFLSLYFRAAQRELRYVNLGRGSRQEKINLGASIFLPQSHWILSFEPNARDEISNLSR